MQIIQVIQKSWKTKIKDPAETIKKLYSELSKSQRIV